MPDELTEVEAAYGTVARCQGRVVCFHPTLPELPTLFGMPNQGFNTRAAIGKAGAHLRLPPRQAPDIQTGLLETKLLQPFHRAQIVVIGLTVVALVRPERLQDTLAKQVLMFFDHGAHGGFVFHPDRRTGPHHEEIPSNPTDLKDAPKLESFGGLALVEAAHSLDVEGQYLVWHDHPTTQEARHMQKEVGAVRIDLL